MITVSHLDDHLDRMRRAGRSPDTIRARRRALARLAATLGFDPADATADDLRRCCTVLAERCTPRTARMTVLLARPYFRHLQAKGYRPDNPIYAPTPRGEYPGASAFVALRPF